MDKKSRLVRLSIIIPCYNESDRIALMFAGVQSFIEQWQGWLEVIIIDDGSRDNTLELLQQHNVTKQYSNIIKVYTQANTGKGGALRNGVLKAQGDYLLTIDADMASPPSEVLKWLDAFNWQLSDDTIYIASREHEQSVINKQGDRKVAGNIFNRIVQTLTPLRIKDTQCGFKLYPAAAGKKYFEGLQTYGWAHDVEILYKAHRDGMKIKEMPVEWNAVEGSKINLLKDGFNMLLEVLAIVIKTKKSAPKK